MKLYVFDHCPFCTRALLAAGLKEGYNIPVNYILEDDEETPVKMIGKQMVPILEYEAGKYMPESLDIVHYLDQLDSKPFLIGAQNSKITEWIDKNFGLINSYVMPLFAKMDLPEFATPSARKKYIDRHEEQFGSFDVLLQESKNRLTEINGSLNQLLDIIDLPHLEEKQYSLDDILLFPLLRALTASKDVLLPNKVRDYIERLSTHSKVHLFFDKAI